MSEPDWYPEPLGIGAIAHISDTPRRKRKRHPLGFPIPEAPMTPYRDRLNAGHYQQGKSLGKKTAEASANFETPKPETTQRSGRRTGRKPSAA